MKAMFAYDHKFCRGDNGQYYSSGQFPYRLWQRYLEFFNELVVVGRVREKQPGEQFENMDLSSGPGVSFIEVPSIHSPLSMLLFRKETASRIREVLKNCDALIVRTSAIGQLASEIAGNLQTPWAVEVVGCAFDSMWNHGSWKGKLYAPLAAYKTRKMIEKAPYAIYVTQRFLQQRYPCPGHSVGCSDVQLEKSDEETLARRLKKIDQAGSVFKIGLIGSLVHSHKGIETALQALGMIRGKLPPFEFCILGGGDPSKWSTLAENYGIASETKFCGTLASGRAVYSWLDDIDLYIQPSLVEGLPRALVEAMSRGCPALGSGAGGIPELLTPECIHKPGDSTTLAKMLEAAILDKAWRKSQAERNFREAAAYESKVLDDIRREFWFDFIKHCKAHRESALPLVLEGEA